MFLLDHCHSLLISIFLITHGLLVSRKGLSHHESEVLFLNSLTSDGFGRYEVFLNVGLFKFYFYLLVFLYFCFVMPCHELQGNGVIFIAKREVTLKDHFTCFLTG